MAHILDELKALESGISDKRRTLAQEYGASRPDLMDFGLSDYSARKVLRMHTPRMLAPTEVVPIPPAGLDDVVVLVPLGEVGRRYLRHDVYLRDAELHQQIRLSATHFGFSDNGVIAVIRPITARWRIGSAAAISVTGVKNAAAICAEADVSEQWPGLATVLELGDPEPVGLPLGFAPNPTGATAALAGLRHVAKADLLATVSAGGTFLDLAGL